MTTPALYTLTTEYRLLLEQLSDADLDVQTIADTIEASGLTDDIAVKAQGIECVARSLEMHNLAIEAEVTRLRAIQISRSKRAQGLRDYLKANMQACGITKIDTPLFSIRLQYNQPAVDIFEPGLLPAEYMRQAPTPPPAPDKTAIKLAIAKGKDVQGARLTRSVSLRVS